MSNSIFNEGDYRLSVVPRWTILRTIQSQSVAEHVFNVERIAHRIAEKWLDLNPDMLYDISQLALHHDDEEAITGDMPSPAKEVYFKEEYLHPDYKSVTKRVVKLADLIEATWFLAMEVKMGNVYVRRHLGNLASKTIQFADEHFGEEIAGKVMELLTSFKNMESDVI